MVEYLDPEIANEGIYAEEAWAPSVPEAKIPDYKGIKAIAKYFPQFTGKPYSHRAFPCWFYHRTKQPVLVHDRLTNEEHPRMIKSAVDWAAELGCTFRKSTEAEIAQGFPLQRWVYTGEWSAKPFHSKFDPANPGTGKTLVDKKNDQGSQTDLIAAVVAAVLAKTAQAPNGPAIDPDRAEFEEFKAWKAMAAQAPLGAVAGVGAAEASNALQASVDEKAAALAEADRLGVKVDRRLGADRILAELAKAN